MILADPSSLLSSLGTLGTGLAELLTLVGAAIGFLIRRRKSIERERQRTRVAASNAASETRNKLEAQLEAEYAQNLADLRDQVRNLQTRNEQLVNLLLARSTDRDD